MDVMYLGDELTRGRDGPCAEERRAWNWNHGGGRGDGVEVEVEVSNLHPLAQQQQRLYHRPNTSGGDADHIW